MKHYQDRVTDINITYIGGGSRGWAWSLMNDLALEPALSGTVKLYDIDIPAAENNAVIGNRISAQPAACGRWQYEVYPKLQAALTGADFVILSILPGTFQEMHSDVHTPEPYGIYQSVGDTVGPGGLIRSLRTLPLFAEFAAAIRKTAPRAWVINYTNPMTLCTRMLYETFPRIKAFGCCHEVFGTQDLLCTMLEHLRGLSGINRQAIRTNVLGINHFTWIDQAYYQDMDLFPLYRQWVEPFAESGFDQDVSPHAKHKWDETPFTSAEKVKFDLFRRYGLIAAAGDRHLAEFVPPWYLKDPATATSWKFSLTPVSWRREDRQSKLEKAARLASGEEESLLKKSGEEGIQLIKALLGLGNLSSNVNLPNRGQQPGLPAGAIVESNALFAAGSVRPLQAGRLPPAVHALVIRQILNQETLLAAVVKADLQLAFNVFCNDPLVNLSLADAKQLFKSMLSGTAEYLPAWCLETGDL